MGPGPTRFIPSLKSRPVGIRDLASELLVHMLSFLDTQDIARCIGVCRYFADLIRCEVFLQYRIELARNGMVDGPSGALPVAERLQRIRQYSANLCNGTLDHETLDSHPEFVRQFRNLEWNSLRPPHISASAMFRVGGFQSSEMLLSIFTRGSSQAGVPSRRWLMPIGTPGDHSRSMNDWAMDRAQDLLVTVEKVYMDMNAQTSKCFEVRFCSLSRSERVRTDHPAASLPCVQRSPPPGNNDLEWFNILFLSIVGCYVVWKVDTRHGQICNSSIEAFDWKAGQFASRIDFGTQKVDMVLLDDTRLVVLPKSSERLPSQQMNIYSLAPSAASRPLVTLQLPDLHLDRGEMAVSYQLISSRHPPDPEAHFCADPSHSMVILTYYILGQDEEYASHLLIPFSTLLAQVSIAAHAVDAHGSSGSPTAPVPWEDWGALKCLRLRVPPAHPGWIDRTSLIPWGSRMPVVAFYGLSPVVYVIDINPFVARHARTLRDNSHSALGTTAIVEDVEVALPGVFDPDCAAIPYVLYRFKITHSPWGAAIRAVRMSMTGFTVTSDDGGRLGVADETWTV